MLNIRFSNGKTFEHYQKIVTEENTFEITGENVYNFIVKGREHLMLTIELESEWTVCEL